MLTPSSRYQCSTVCIINVNKMSFSALSHFQLCWEQGYGAEGGLEYPIGGTLS